MKKKNILIISGIILAVIIYLIIINVSDKVPTRITGEEFCKEIQQEITQEQTGEFATEGLPLTVKLEKVCTSEVDNLLRVRVYWKITNSGFMIVSAMPHEGYTKITSDSVLYNSKMIDYYDLAEDDYVTDEGRKGGRINPGKSGQGGVNVEGLPLNTDEIQISLEVLYYEDFAFDTIKI